MSINPNLLSVTTVPIKIEINITQGTLENPREPKPSVNIKTGEGGLEVHAEPAKINIDTYGARSSLGYGGYNSKDFVKKEADKGISIAYEATARLVNEGESYVRGSKSSDIALERQKAGQDVRTVMEFLPKEGAEVTFSKNQLNINYNVKDVNIDWKNLKTAPLKFNPGKLDIYVSQMPKVEIEYTGEPIYVPPSAAPDYE